jgi:hypothetical protein
MLLELFDSFLQDKTTSKELYREIVTKHLQFSKTSFQNVAQINLKIAKQEKALATYKAFNEKWKTKITQIMQDDPDLEIPIPSFKFEDIDLSKFKDEDGNTHLEFETDNLIIRESLDIMNVDP